MVTNEAMSFPWEGFKLNVPDKALPDGISEYPVNIKVSQMGQFELPEGYELVSAVYWVYVPGRFTKPLTIEVQHYANFSNPNQLHSVHSSCTQKSLPYKFKVVDGGSFNCSSKYGILSTTHFSGNGVAKRHLVSILAGTVLRTTSHLNTHKISATATLWLQKR